MAAARRRIALLLLLAVALAGLAPAPAPALARPASPPALQTAPCYAAAMAALTKRGAIYSQGGHLAGDPIDLSTGQPYPRTGPNSFDCSGLVWWSYAQAGISIGSTTYQQLNNGVRIDCTLADLDGESTRCWTLGDLVFLRYSGGQHVAIYVGSGLFMDCYNHATGCILHDVTTDSFYLAHFYQARRIVSGCESMTIDPGQPTSSTTDDPDLEFIPDLLGYVAFYVPQCGECHPDGSLILPFQEEPLPEFDFNPLYPFRWLAISIQNLIVKVLCWLFAMLQMLLKFVSQVVNLLISGINAAWRLAIYVWINLRAWIYIQWAAFEQLLAWMNDINNFIILAGAWLSAILAVVLQLLELAGQILLFIVQISITAINLLGWIGAMVLSLIINILAALQGTTTPIQLSSDHIVYRMVRGSLEALNDSQLGWLLTVAYVLAYVGFVVWMARFLSASKDT